MDTSTNILEYSRLLDLPSELSSPKTLCVSGSLDLPGISDLPQEIINEIILLVPLIDLFRVSKVCHQFKKLAYFRQTTITTETEYQEAAEKGDILSLINCSLPYWNLSVWCAACTEGHMDIVQFLLAKYTTDKNEKFLHQCKEGNMDIIKYMRHKGDNVLNIGLSDACEGKLRLPGNASHPLGGHMEIVQFLISKGANDWNNGLYYSCRGGHMDMVQLMIEKGADEWNVGFDGACEGGHMNIVQFMIEKGADEWNWGLRYACYGGHMDIIHLMIKKGANICNCGKSINYH